MFKHTYICFYVCFLTQKHKEIFTLDLNTVSSKIGEIWRMNVFNRKQTKKQKNTKEPRELKEQRMTSRFRNEEKPVTNLGKDICENVQRKCGRQRGIANQ